jgi:HD-GYP domain-containing protein (c-di-GMP phosphodiesterase class II)
MAKIRELSSPPLYDFDNADDYSKRLRKNFETIGQLAGENRDMLDKVLYPILESDEQLSEEAIEEMSEFGEQLLSLAEDVTDFENLDLPIMSLTAERLAKDAKEREDLPNLIVQMDAAFLANYSLMNMTERISTCPELSRKYKEKGLKIGEFFLEMIEKDQFLRIEDMELRGLVLTNARFVTAFYERSDTEEENNYNLDLLDKMLKIADDEFYQKALPDYDWKYYKIRVYGYYLQCTDMGNMRHFNHEQLLRIVKAADEAEALIASDPEYFDNLNGNEGIPFQCARNRYFAGVLSEWDYRHVLLEAYDKRDPEDFGVDGNFANVLIPLEIIHLFKGKRLAAADQLLLKKLYQGISAYMFHIPNAGALSFVMEYFSEVVRNFIEVPGGITMEEFALQSLAALHPPTYVHSRMVGQISTCLCGYLVDIKPEVLVGACGCNTAEEVRENRDRFLNYTYHAAICHDFGKIPIIDTIFVYGRRLLDDEFAIIKTHPLMGYRMLKRYESTKEYGDVAYGHHRFYDDSKGYPFDLKTADSPYKPIIDLVQCADCMDAATDSVGRSYNRGKTIDDYVKEVREGSGTRYAPWLIDLFDREEVRRDMDFLLTTGREETYRDTYLLLKNVKEKGDKDKK